MQHQYKNGIGNLLFRYSFFYSVDDPGVFFLSLKYFARMLRRYTGTASRVANQQESGNQ